jgi:hypothetical protein
MATKFHGEPASVRNRKTLFTYGHNPVGEPQRHRQVGGDHCGVAFDAIERSEDIRRVPHVRQSVHGPKTMGDPDFLPRGVTNVCVCGFH